MSGRRAARRRPRPQAHVRKDATRVRFWRWFRTLPILVMLIFAAVTFSEAALPDNVLRSTIYPLRHVDAIEASSARHGIDSYLAAAVIKCESDWNEEAGSHAGAVGLMQLMPATAQEMVRLGVVDGSAYDPDDLTDPDTNIEFGCAYLGWLQRQSSSLDEVIAAYNAGPGIVDQWLADGSADDEVENLVQYPETRSYLQRVEDAYNRYQELYPAGLA